MAELITNYYNKSKDPMEYCNPLVRECLEKEISLKELSPEQADASVVFHLSPERQNLLLWYPFAPESHLLELGAGSGSLSEKLCEKVSRVDCFDLSMENCKLNEVRNRKRENLRIFPGSPFEAEGLERYDYIVVNDDLKNAGRYFSEDNPYTAYLRALKKLLKPQGHLLLAVGNRLALKYLAGAPDGCSGRYFESINRYPNNRSQREFSKGELSHLLQESQFSVCRWYYPYPDQIFPNEIFTKDTMSTYGYGRKYNNFVPGRLQLFREDLLAKDLMREGSMEIHANAFLVDVTLQETEASSNITYVKMNCDRREEFQIYTVIAEADGERYVDKLALKCEAVSHLKKMQQYESEHQEGAYACLAGEWMGEGIRYPFLSGKSLDAEVEHLIAERNVGAILSSIREASRRMDGERQTMGEKLYDSEFQAYFGKEEILHAMECVRPANIDLILGNIFEAKDRYVTIDNEWILDTWVPIKFILWRSVNELVYAHPAIEDVMTREELYKQFDISKEEALLFDAWNHHFVEEYVQGEVLHRYAIAPQSVCMERDLERKTGITSTLYLDYGEGLSEENTLQSFCLLEGERFRITYDVSRWKDVKEMRWDPLEGSICCCRAFAVTEQGRRHPLKPLNDCGVYEDRDAFATVDPQYRVEVSYLQEGKLTLEGQITYLNYQELEERFLRPRNLLEKMGRKWEKMRQE